MVYNLRKFFICSLFCFLPCNGMLRRFGVSFGRRVGSLASDTTAGGSVSDPSSANSPQEQSDPLPFVEPEGEPEKAAETLPEDLGRIRIVSTSVCIVDFAPEGEEPTCREELLTLEIPELVYAESGEESITSRESVLTALRQALSCAATRANRGVQIVLPVIWGGLYVAKDGVIVAADATVEGCRMGMRISDVAGHVLGVQDQGDGLGLPKAMGRVVVSLMGTTATVTATVVNTTGRITHRIVCDILPGAIVGAIDIVARELLQEMNAP